jgi:hypothetical protein
MAPKRATSKSAAVRDLKPEKVTPAVVEKTIKDNYLRKGLADEDCFVTIIKGKTLETLTREDLHRKNKDSTFKMGLYYFKAMRDLYRSEQHPSKRLKVDPSAQLSVNPALLKAMVAVKSNMTDTAGIQAYLGQATVVNRTELVGICKWALELRSSHPKHLLAILDVLRFFKRCEIVDKYPEMWSALYQHFELSLCILRTKNKHADAETFSSLHRGILIMFLSPVKLDAVIARCYFYVRIQQTIHVLFFMERCMLAYVRCSFIEGHRL